MENLSVKLDGKFEGGKISLGNAPLIPLTASLDAIKKLITRTSRGDDHVAVSLVEGSVEMITHLPSDAAIVLREKIDAEILQEGDPYAEFISTLSKVSRTYGLSYVISDDHRHITTITPDGNAMPNIKQTVWMSVTMNIFGYLISMGGKFPNIHIETEQYGRVTIDISPSEIRKLQLYNHYNFEVSCRIQRDDPEKIDSVKFIHAIKASGETSLEEAIQIEGNKWNDIDDPIAWLENIRGGR